MRKIGYFSLINFLAAFLLFQIELITAKLLLPQFGGSYLVWGAAVVFFQCTLLLGYLYAHQVVTRLGMRSYARFHLLLVFLPLLVFPGRAFGAVQSHYGIPLVFDVFAVLALKVGLVFFVLSTTTVVFQSWLSASDLPERAHPYALYAVSNLGSFAALLTYPFLFEPYLDLSRQLLIWRVAYAVLALLHVAVFYAVRMPHEAALRSPRASPVASRLDMARWFVYSAAGVTAFLAVTNIITYEIAPMPLLWVIPLGVYLLTFVLNFKHKPWCPPWIAGRFHEILALGVAVFLLTTSAIYPVIIQCAAHVFILFLVCMYCQNRLALTRPAHEGGLTLFYLMIAAGGFCAGVLTSWIMPLVAPGMMEYLLAFVLVCLAGAVGSFSAPITFRGVRMISYTMAFVALWFIRFPRYHAGAMLLLVAMLLMLYAALRENPKALFVNTLCVMLIAPAYLRSDIVFIARNYYGIHAVVEKDRVRILNHGTTIHGLQYRDPARAREPLGYYFPGSGIGKLMTGGRFTFRSVGIIGLGAGGITSYAQPGQSVDVYEIDPLVHRIARSFFSFLDSSPAPVNVIFGDARLTLSRSDARYDLLVVDAFSGDSIPAHLLTLEALQLYRTRISPAGVVLFHVSNRYLDLIPQVFATAGSAGATAVFHIVDTPASFAAFPSRWVAVTWDAAALRSLVADGWRTAGDPHRPVKTVRPWTDSYSSILPALDLFDRSNVAGSVGSPW